MKPLLIVDKLAKNIADLIPEFVVNLVARISIFMIFWPSAQLKLEGDKILGQIWTFWSVNDSAFMLFQYEYALPIIPYNIAAYLGTFTEFFFSIFILLGFLTRLSALVFITMTMVIEIFVYPDLWTTHILWLAPLLYLIKKGGGEVSMDKLILRRS